MKRLVMMGTGTFAEPTFAALLAGPNPVVGLFTQPEREGVKLRSSTRQTGRGMAEMAAERGVPVFRPERVNAAEGVALLRSVSPDLLVVAAYGQILSREVLGVPTAGAINVHASLLPKYRGAAPVAWAIASGDHESGVTIIRISTGLDAGDMLAQERLTILPDETAGELEARLAILGARMAMEVIMADTFQGVPQPTEGVTKAPKLTKEMGLIDWTRPGVCLRIRAMHPWPTPYAYLHVAGKPAVRLIVHRARSVEGMGEPGTVLRADGTLIVAGNGEAIELLEVQPAGKKRMLTADFLRGHVVRPGERFGGETLTL